MKKCARFLLAGLLTSSCLGASANQIQSITEWGDLSGFVTDRYAPQVFTGIDGNTVLQLGVRENGQQANRLSPYNDAFYNYQGMQMDLTNYDGPASVGIDMFVDSTWDVGTRAGFWSVMSNGALRYPIIEWVVESSYTGFRYWQTNIGWIYAPTAPSAQNQWYSLEIVLNNDSTVDYWADNFLLGSTSAFGADSIDAIILQAHNQGPAGEYDVLYDNFSHAAVVPVPAATWMGFLGIGMIAARRRLKKS